MIITILLCISVILLGAVVSRPVGWVVVALGIIALLLALGGAHFHLG